MNRIHIYEERLKKVNERLRNIMAISKACLDVGITLDQYRYAQKVVNTTKTNKNTGEMIANTYENSVNSGGKTNEVSRNSNVNANKNSVNSDGKTKKKELKTKVNTNKNNRNLKGKTKESSVKIKVKTPKTKGKSNVKTNENNLQSGGNNISKTGISTGNPDVKTGELDVKTGENARTNEENQKLYEDVKKYYDTGLSIEKSCIKAGIKSSQYYKICKLLGLKSAAIDNNNKKLQKQKPEEIFEKTSNVVELQKDKKFGIEDFLKTKNNKGDVEYYKSRAKYFQNRIEERAKILE